MSWECRVNREEVLLDVDWWSVLRQKGAALWWKQQRLVWNRLGAPPQSSVEATLNWRSDCTDSRRVNSTVAKWCFKPSAWGWGDGWNRLSWALADLQRALNSLSSQRRQLSESLTPLKSYDSMTSLSSQMRRLTDVLLCFSESLPTQPPTFPPTIPPAKEGKKTWCNHDVILGFGFLLDLFVSSFKNQGINKR